MKHLSTPLRSQQDCTRESLNEGGERLHPIRVIPDDSHYALTYQGVDSEDR